MLPFPGFRLPVIIEFAESGGLKDAQHSGKIRGEPTVFQLLPGQPEYLALRRGSERAGKATGPKQGTELQNSLEIVNKIAQVHPSYMSVTYGAGGSTVGYSAALAKQVQDNDIPALAHLTCVKADEEKIKEVLGQLKANGIASILALRGDIPAGLEKDAIGSFAHASDLMRFIKEQDDFCVSNITAS